jgi:WXXGXW repeat (2 copies)
MRIFQAMRVNSMRAMLLALLVCVIPASSRAGVFISVGFAPPVLPVYVQPPCPEPGLMWTPGFWSYGPDGYYWVPGTWVPAPQVGFLWTPPYWGWQGGLYVFHGGYWGPHVGYYGGVNYGFGYMGVGFAGGVWAGGAFRYNTAVMNVGPGIHNTYVDTTIVHNTTIVNNTHVAYSGGPGGVNHPPTAQENSFSHEQHVAPTPMQTQHETAARSNTNNYASHNGGHPQNVAMARPAGGNANSRPGGGNANTTRAVNYNASKSNTGNVTPRDNNTTRENNTSRANTEHTPAPRTYNASHSNTNAAPSHPAGGQTHQSAPPQHAAHQAPPPRQEEHGHR